MTLKQEQFAEKLQKLLDKYDMKQRDLAIKIGATDSTVSQYLKGDRLPKYELIQKIALAFNVSTDYLLNVETETIPDETVKIPVLGEVRAGQPSLIMDSNIDGYEYIDSKYKNNEDEYFALKIKGDSMSPRFCEGDIVIVKKQDYIESNEIGIVLVNGDEATVKKIKKTSSGIMLIPLNPEYETKFFTKDEIFLKPVQIIGRVIELRAKY